MVLHIMFGQHTVACRCAALILSATSQLHMKNSAAWLTLMHHLIIHWSPVIPKALRSYRGHLIPSPPPLKTAPPTSSAEALCAPHASQTPRIKIYLLRNIVDNLAPRLHGDVQVYFHFVCSRLMGCGGIGAEHPSGPSVNSISER